MLFFDLTFQQKKKEKRAESNLNKEQITFFPPLFSSTAEVVLFNADRGKLGDKSCTDKEIQRLARN